MIVLLIGATSCRAPQPRVSQEDDLETLALQVVGKDHSIELNQSGTYALLHEKPSSDHMARKYTYAVVRVSDHMVLRRGVFRMGYVKWKDETSIEVYSGSPSDQDGGTKTIIDVTSPVE